MVDPGPFSLGFSLGSAMGFSSWAGRPQAVPPLTLLIYEYPSACFYFYPFSFCDTQRLGGREIGFAPGEHPLGANTLRRAAEVVQEDLCLAGEHAVHVRCRDG